MRKIDRRIVIVFTLLVTVGLAYGLMRFLISLKEEPPFRPPTETRRFVQVDTVRYGSVNSPILAPGGRLASIAEVDVVAEASGKIMPGEVPLKVGASFQKGDTLFVTYEDEAKLALEARKSEFLNSLANILPDIRIDFPEHESTFMGFFRSIELEKPLPSFPEISDEKLKVFLASRNILSSFYQIRKDEMQLNRYTIRAPFEGTYTQVFLEVGAYTNMGGRVAHIIRTDEMELEVPLERLDAEWVKVGDPVRVKADRRDLEWQGKVVRKSHFVDPDFQMQTVFVKMIPKPNQEALAGEYFSTTFPGRPVPDVMEIPRNAVFNSNEVFIVDNERLVRKTVNIIKTNATTILMNGLKEGELLVVQPLINVQEGILVDYPGNQTQVGNSKRQSASGR